MHAVLLYNCPALTDGCSSCIGVSMVTGFECGWCDRPSGMTDTCSFIRDCPSQLLTSGSQCPEPTITGFTPNSGPPQGGTTITINGTNLGVSFNDFTGNSIQVGGVDCTPVNPDSYIPGRRVSCTTTSSVGNPGLKTILITLPNGSRTSDTQFNVVSPRITGVFPSRGPQAGGTLLTVYGTDLNIGNVEDTRITLVGGTECIVEYVDLPLPLCA